jgi:isocitrate dehydrogenase
MQSSSFTSSRASSGAFAATKRVNMRQTANKNTHVCNATHKIAVLSGDGIGPEIMAVALEVLKAAGQSHGEEFAFTPALIGGAATDATGDPFPPESLEICKASDAVLLAAIGG